MYVSRNNTSSKNTSNFLRSSYFIASMAGNLFVDLFHLILISPEINVDIRTSFILQNDDTVVLPGATIIFCMFLVPDFLLFARIDRFRHHRRRRRRHRDSFSRLRREHDAPKLRSPWSLHTALDFVSNKSRGLRNLAYDLALMQTLFLLALSLSLTRSLALPSATVFFSRQILLLLLSLLSRGARTHRLYFTSRLGKKDKVLMSDTISI